MNIRELQAITTWARNICHTSFGPVEGERVFRSLSAKMVLNAWPSRTLILA